MRHATKKPAKRCPFQRPAHGDPLSLELDWKNQRDEEQRSASEERHLCIARRTGERCVFEQHSESQKQRQSKRRWHKAGNCVRISCANDVKHQIKVQRPCQCGCRPWHCLCDELLMENKRKDAEQRIKSQIPSEWQRGARRIE